MFYSHVVRPLLFLQDPEKAHERTIEMLASLSGLTKAPVPFTDPLLESSIAGLIFPNPVGLAAGCDKNAKAVSIWPRFGFGFVEVGTITAQPQPGNPRPRVFRVHEHGALVNRLGFNSEGSEAVARRLALLRLRSPGLKAPLAVNIGKSKVVTDEDAVLEDYCASFRCLAPYADLVVVNVSSPNTPGLRQWQERDKLILLLQTLQQEARLLPLPLFVKISPDMADGDMFDVADVAQEAGLAGIIATNTTITREGATADVNQEGGLSGKPLKERATEVMRLLYQHTQGKLPLIGVGGIFSAEDAYYRIRAGASLVQIYTGMVYEGPYLPRRINEGLLRLMERDGVKSLLELIGVDANTTLKLQRESKS